MAFARAGIATAILLLGATAPAVAQEHSAYFLINGPEYREVTRAQFDDMRSSCLRIDVKDYPDVHVVEYHCYL